MQADGESVCSFCHCGGYVDAVEVDERNPYRVKQHAKFGNSGVGHPLRAALSRVEPDSYVWLDIECAGCKVSLSPETALVLDSAFYCGPCFIQRPEVYCGASTSSEAAVH